jgi:hypothetical protein
MQLPKDMVYMVPGLKQKLQSSDCHLLDSSHKTGVPSLGRYKFKQKENSRAIVLITKAVCLRATYKYQLSELM